MNELRASDLRQYLYCPRVVYFSLVVPVDRVETFKMSAGRDAEREHARLERRRSLARYGLADGIRRYDVPVVCAKLGVSGQTFLSLTEIWPLAYPIYPSLPMQKAALFGAAPLSLVPILTIYSGPIYLYPLIYFSPLGFPYKSGHGKREDPVH